MEQITYTCDRCEKEIEDVVYTLTCYAKDIPKPGRVFVSRFVADQNSKQNLDKMCKERHLCKECKDAITDGVFIV